jgi:TetR/AcrR family transcriptional regulator
VRDNLGPIRDGRYGGVVTLTDAGADRPAASILAAGRRLALENGAAFTTQDLIKEAGVALQTFYRYYGGKDQLILAVLADMIAEHAANLATAAQGIDDPIARLELYVRTTLAPLRDPAILPAAQFVTSEHWRLHAHYAAEVWAATQPVTDLIRAELEAGRARGVLAPRNPERDAWLITKTILSAYHHCSFLPDDPPVATIADDVWGFCLAAVGGKPPASRRKPRR